MNRHVNAIAGRLSLRHPQRRSLRGLHAALARARTAAPRVCCLSWPRERCQNKRGLASLVQLPAPAANFPVSRT